MTSGGSVLNAVLRSNPSNSSTISYHGFDSWSVGCAHIKLVAGVHVHAVGFFWLSCCNIIGVISDVAEFCERSKV